MPMTARLRWNLRLFICSRVSRAYVSKDSLAFFNELCAAINSALALVNSSLNDCNCAFSFVKSSFDAVKSLDS